MKVLCIDGPARGKIHDIRNNLGGRFLCTDIISGQSDVMYYIQRFQVAGIMFWLSSIHMFPDDINPHDVFEFVVSDLAKQALVER